MTVIISPTIKFNDTNLHYYLIFFQSNLDNFCRLVRMEPVAYDELLDNSQTDRQDGANGTQGPRPHAQVHLLSPTDKCKVENLGMINSSFDKNQFFVKVLDDK